MGIVKNITQSAGNVLMNIVIFIIVSLMMAGFFVAMMAVFPFIAFFSLISMVLDFAVNFRLEYKDD